MGSKRFVFCIACFFVAIATSRGDTIWDGDGGDGLWTTATNWSPDVLPAAGDVITISNGDTVDFNAGAQNLPAGCTVNLTGNSVLTEDSVIRLNGSTITVASNSALTGGFWDLANGTLNFDDGAVATMSNWEHKGNNTFRFTLSASGFTALTPVTLRLGGGATMSNATYIVDMASYTGAMDTIELIDFAVNLGGVTAGNFQWATLIITNAGIYTNAFIAFDGSGHIVQVAFPAPPAAPVTWTGDGGDDSWTTPDNWDTDSVPLAADHVVVGLTASITNGQNEFANLKIEAGASVTFSEWTASGNVITNAGIINYTGVYRLTGAPGITLTGSGSFGADITFLDTQGATINFEDGASFANTSMPFEHRYANVFGYKLSETGFATINAGTLHGGSGAVWSDATYNIDVSAYNYSNGTTIVLADYSSHAAAYNGTFDPTVNIIATNGLGGALSFDTSLSQLVLMIDPPGNDAPVAYDQTVSLKTNAPVAFMLLATDIEGSNLTYTVETQPSFGSLSGVAPDLTYTPTGDVFSFDSFTFTAFDGEDVSNTGTVTIARIPNTDNELWATYHDAILNDVLNAEWLTNWVEDGISMWQMRYDLGPLVGSRTNASPKMGAFYAYPIGGTNLPGLVQIHGGGGKGNADLAKFWAEQGYAAISINWGAGELLAGVPNTDWDGLPAGHFYPGTDFQDGVDPHIAEGFASLYDVPHPLNSSWILNSYAARRALTFLTDQSSVDTNKLGVVGWSMGGRTTILVATDPRLTAIGPGVGGTGFLYEDWWGLPGSGRSTNGVEDVDLYNRTVAAQSYWPDITAPTLYLEAANDFNAPFDLVIKALGLQDTNVPQQLAVSLHLNHRNWPDAEASRVLWMKTYLAGTFDFPERSPAVLDLSNPDGVPRFRVWPDTSTTNPIVSVDIHYGIERDSRLRFWRDTAAVETNGYWEAECPVYDLNEMMAAMAIIKYEAGYDVPLISGQSSLFSIASDVLLVYPPDLENNGIKATAEKTRLIDDFALGFKDWWYNNLGGAYQEVWTRKFGDPSWRGPAGGELALDVVTTAAGNSLGARLNTLIWNGTDATTYNALVPVSAIGTNSVSIPVSAFTNGNGQALTTWDDVKYLGLISSAWSGDAPTYINLRWTGGEWFFTNGVTSAWLEQFGLGLNDLTVLSDTDMDGLLNWEEKIAGTVPTNIASGFWFSKTTRDSDDMVIEWPAVSGKTYSLYKSSDLVNSNWGLEESNLPYVLPTGATTVSLVSGEDYFSIRVE